MKILKFSAEWCSPCRMLSAQLSKYNGYDILNYDFSDNENEFNQFNVKNIPTLIVVNDENLELDRKTGSITLEQFEEWLKKIENEKLDISK